MSRELILHIGNHKTGTTSIQNALYMNREVLGEAGWSLFYRSAEGQDKQDGHPGLWTIPFDDPRRGVQVHKDLVKNLSELPDNVIMSQENFSWVFEKSVIQKFADDLAKYFDKVRIIVYLRRQDQQMVSHHQQASKNFKFMAGRLFGNKPNALPDYDETQQLYLNYLQRLSYWADVFGKENIIFRIFERQALTDGDSVSDFSSVLNLDLPMRPERKNESNGFEKTKVNHLMNQLAFPMKQRNWVNSFLNNEGKLLPSAEQARDYYKHFVDSNVLLNEKFNISSVPELFSDDFSMYPDQADDTWDEVRGNQAIVNLLRVFKTPKYMTRSDVELVRKVIDELKLDNPGLANKLETVLKRK